MTSETRSERTEPSAPAEAAMLDRLDEMIRARRDGRPEGSYVVSLLDGGWEKMAAKIREEAEEVVIAGRDESDEALTKEVADLIFHVWVMMASRGVSPSGVYAELARRFGTGGLVEKASRSQPDGAEPIADPMKEK